MATESSKSTVNWHCLDSEAVAARLDSHPVRGLSGGAARLRLAESEPNVLREARRRNLLLMLAGQFTDVMILVLIAAACVAAIIGEPQDTIFIAVIIVLNGIIGFVQEYRAERAMAALKSLANPQARVIRDGTPGLVDARELVCGDLIELEAGNIRAHMLLAEIYLQERDAERARKEVEAALKIDPQNYQAKMLLGNIYLGQQKYAEAQAAYDGLIKAEPNNPAGYFRLGALQQARKQYDQALASYDKALAINPNMVGVQSNIDAIREILAKRGRRET